MKEILQQYKNANDPFFQQKKAEQEKMTQKLIDRDLQKGEFGAFMKQSSADSKAYLKQKLDDEKASRIQQVRERENILGMTKEQFNQAIADADDPQAKRRELLNQLRAGSGQSERRLKRREGYRTTNSKTPINNQKRSEAKDRAQNHQGQNPGQPVTTPPPPPSQGPPQKVTQPIDNSINDSFDTEITDSFDTELDQQNDTTNTNTTTVGDNNTIYGGVGNQSTVTINSQGTGSGSGLNNMQSAAAYSALNNNAQDYSSSILNGYGRAAGAVDLAESQLGVTDRVANIYNMMGMSQDYWSNKAVAHQADYLGDIWKDGGFDFKMPGDYKPAEDKTEEIADGMDFKN